MNGVDAINVSHCGSTSHRDHAVAPLTVLDDTHDDHHNHNDDDNGTNSRPRIHPRTEEMEKY